MSAIGAFFSPRALKNARTIRSAAPLSSMHFPMTAAIAMTIPMLPQADPKAVATREIEPAHDPAPSHQTDSRLTIMAAVIKAMKALTFRPMMRPKTVAIPHAKMTSGRTISV